MPLRFTNRILDHLQHTHYRPSVAKTIARDLDVEVDERQCGKLKLKRLIGAGAGVIFKGSGFYQTDYRSDSYKKAAAADKKAAEPKTSTKGEKKTESKSTSDKKSDNKTSKSSE